MMTEELCEFGKKLIDARDLDPVYVLLHKAKLEPERLRRFLMAYWCFYHVGVASELSKDPNWTKAGKEVRIRGAERRHFRGPKALAALDWLEQCGDEWFDELLRCRTFGQVSHIAQTPMLFGPWIAFKIGDMLERLGLGQISFKDCELRLYREPHRGAGLILFGNPDAYVSWEGMNNLVTTVVASFDQLGYKAPPSGDRGINIQEVETMLCKFKSHKNGHYPVGKDVHEVEHALREWNSDLVSCLPL